jgi:O-acetyl-ADP-ribose deacetylase (regulator of RNase III)
MKIKIQQGSIFESLAQAYVNPVNCRGVSGKGLALDFKNKYPDNYEQYRKFCRDSKLIPGRIHMGHEGGKIIFNFPTKDDWKDPSQYEYIELGLNALVVECLRTEIKSVAMPALGCGLGKLDFGKVIVLIERAFFVTPNIDVTVYVK